MRKTICFDLDGTVADLYAVNNWKGYLEDSNATPYLIAEPMWNMQELAETLLLLKLQDWEIQVITWLAKDSTQCYKDEVRQAKLEWLEQYNFPFDSFSGVQYGATKANSVRHKTDYAILIDDNEKVRNGWTLGATINPVEVDIIKELQKLLK